MLEGLKSPTEADTEYWLMEKLFKSGFICPISRVHDILEGYSGPCRCGRCSALVESAEKDCVLIADNVRTDLTHRAIVDDDTGL